MTSTKNLVVTCLCLSLILLHLLKPAHANQNPNPYCAPSSCGIIRNISHPFRLKDDPEHCGYGCYELACENNVASVYLNSQKYHVKEINYQNETIRLADASINNNICSFPKYSVYDRNFMSYYPPYTTWRDDIQYEADWPINFMSCQYRLNSSLYTEITDCANGHNFFDASNSSSGRYIKVGHMNVSDVQHMCKVDIIVMTSWKFKDIKNASVSEIHDSLLYGFELAWSRFCIKCDEAWRCASSKDHLDDCGPSASGLGFKLLDQLVDIIWYFTIRDGPYTGLILIPVLITVLFAAVSIAAKIIIGFTFVFGLLILADRNWHLLKAYGTLVHLRFIIGPIFAARLIIVFPCVVGFLIYKFRRRHLSMFVAIENFLQSDNKLMPIRYSYSDIKKMTRGFQEKLGEGGYGSVYKGKLRSGHDVAVKLLRKPRANGQDFINEIATIGRIHHVNVIKLVGYCAERSRRALVFDFMLNGSLEKYLYSREKMDSLNWDMKYKIAVGVARGIEYLHRGCDIQILHFDIKPHNILLDDKFIPKISDFGLAKVCSTQKNTVTLTAARGTIGYVAPELINRGIGGVSYKADVYSFGMLLMEMVGLNKNLVGNNETSSQYFPQWIYNYLNQGKDIEIGKVDEDNDDNNDCMRENARKITIVALWCIQMSPDDRPSMNEVVAMLEGEVEHLQIPPQPSQSRHEAAVNEDQTWTTRSTDSVSLLYHDADANISIAVQDLQSLKH